MDCRKSNRKNRTIRINKIRSEIFMSLEHITRLPFMPEKIVFYCVFASFMCEQYIFENAVRHRNKKKVFGLLLTMSLYAPRIAALMIPRNKPITLSTTEAHSRRCRWITSQQLLTPVNS